MLNDCLVSHLCMKRIIPIIALLLLAGWTFSSNDAALRFFKVDRENNDMVVTWEATAEEGMDRYELQRKTRFTNNQYIVVSDVEPHGADKQYRLIDDQVYKSSSERVDYRLEAVFENGVRKELAAQSISYTPTAVRRTWGSIKAMFQ